MKPDLSLERSLPGVVAGVDEAGRGPLCGPVVAAAVIIDKEIAGINDSKKLTAAKRAQLYQEIVASCRYGVGIVSEQVIDEINILQATLLAMRQALDKLGSYDYALIDGNQKPLPGNKIITVVKGDATSLSIAAASIVAKYTRDALVLEAAKKFPEYGFDRHFGYGTKQHREMILKYGPCEYHRRSFLKKLIASSN